MRLTQPLPVLAFAIIVSTLLGTLLWHIVEHYFGTYTALIIGVPVVLGFVWVLCKCSKPSK